MGFLFYNIMEIWKHIQGYEGIYQISNFGNVKSLKFNNNKIIIPSINSSGYYNISLFKKNIRKTVNIHKLVAIAFLNHNSSGHKLVVNHKDLNKLNNNVDNLEIVTQRENSNLLHKKYSSKNIGVSWRKDKKKWVSQISINGKNIHLGYFTNELDASNAYKNKLKEIEL